LDSKALTKIQSVALIAIVLVAAVGGGAAYVLWSATLPPPEDIRIGVCADLDGPYGKDIWRGAVLAAEQVNAQGGVLGRNFTLLGEDDDSGTSADISVGINALTKLITVDQADYVISMGAVNLLAYQDVCCEHKKIFLSVGVGLEDFSQRVLDDYEKYKYSFRISTVNNTASSARVLDETITIRNYTGFTKVALLFDDFPVGKALGANLDQSLRENGFEVVYNTPYALLTTDFTSHLAAIEASGAEILVPYILTQGAVPFVKEWYDRQSPFIVWGNLLLATYDNFWEVTGGKCDTVSFAGPPVAVGYPWTSKVLPFREAYVKKWGENPTGVAAAAYDAICFILPDAIKRGGTTETEAVIKALEKTDVETTQARHFVFTSSHDVLVGSGTPNSPFEDYMVINMFQWQNGTQVPVSPEKTMLEAGATFKYPPWRGPWSK